MKEKTYELESALERMLAACSCLETKKIMIYNLAGRVLATDVTAQYDIPLFDRSPLDGYAFRAAETADASREHPVRFFISEEIPAGSHSEETLQPGNAVKILTGAPIPDGADAVIRFEDTEVKDGYVTVFQSFSSGDNIVKKGEDVRQGDVIAKKGTVIDAAIHGMFASQGISSAEVYETPLIGILSQGNELLEIGEELSAGKIYNSNRYMLHTALKKAGFSSIYLGIVSDQPSQIEESLDRASDMYDAILMTGGVSVGTYDYTERALEQAGAEILVDRVRMKPGSSCCLAILNGSLVFGLSGNPTAAMTTFHLIVLPVLRKIAGRTDYMPQRLQVKLAEPFPKKSPTLRILKGRLDMETGELLFYVNEHQQNGAVSAMKGTDVFAMVPAGSGPVEAGTILEAYRI